jgi:hypothetical protein
MTPFEFWTELFSGQIRAMAPEVGAEGVTLFLSANQRNLYGGYLGPSSLTCVGKGCVWTFDRCPHGERTGTCDAHLGYLRGTLIGLGLGDVAVTRQFASPKCRLAITWG